MFREIAESFGVGEKFTGWHAAGEAQLRMKVRADDVLNIVRATSREELIAALDRASKDRIVVTTGTDLTGINLRHRDLRRVVFEPQVRLWGADLQDAMMEGMDLSGLNLSNARMLRTNLNGAQMRDALFVGATFMDTCLDGANLSGANLSYSDFFPKSALGTIFDKHTKTTGWIRPHDLIDMGYDMRSPWSKREEHRLAA